MFIKRLFHAQMNMSSLTWDITFSVVDVFTGDRASDLGRNQSRNVFKLRDREGYLLRFILAILNRRAWL